MVKVLIATFLLITKKEIAKNFWPLILRIKRIYADFLIIVIYKIGVNPFNPFNPRANRKKKICLVFN